MTRVTLHRVKRPHRSNPNRRVWMLRWHDSSGKRCGETIGLVGKMTKREAEAARREKQSKFDSGLAPVDRPQKIALAEFEAHDSTSIIDRRPGTRRDHHHCFAHAIRILGATRRIDTITRTDVGKIKSTLHAEGKAAATIDKVIRTLRAAFNRAMQDGLIRENPFTKQSVRWEPRAPRIFAPEEVQAMIHVAPNNWWAMFIQLLATTGLRRNEALHLRWRDLDLDSGHSVTVRRHEAGSFQVDGKSFPILPWSAKAQASYRTIPLPSETIHALNRHKAKYGRSAYVFLTLDRLSAIAARQQAGTLRDGFDVVNNLHRDFREIQTAARHRFARSAGIKDEEVDWPFGSLHDLRDTYLTAVKDLPIDVLKRVAGHANIATTLKYYTSPSERDADAVRNALKRSGFGIVV